MKTHKVWILITVVCLSLIPVGPGWAGGWATITLDRWPQEAAAGVPLEIGFTVRQHGRDDQRMNDLSPSVRIQNRQTGEGLNFNATRQGADGHYLALVKFPSPGRWSWSIAAFNQVQPMPELEVIPNRTLPVPEAGAALAAGRPVITLPGYSLLAVLILGIIVMSGRKRPGWAPAMVITTLLVGGLGLVSFNARQEPAVVFQSQITHVEDLGERLFVAKGCISCHSHRDISSSLVELQTDMGPDLDNYTASAELLRVWLKDPKAVKPQTQMPNLELREVEIEALIAFLNTAD